MSRTGVWGRDEGTSTLGPLRRDLRSSPDVVEDSQTGRVLLGASQPEWGKNVDKG